MCDTSYEHVQLIIQTFGFHHHNDGIPFPTRFIFGYCGGGGGGGGCFIRIGWRLKHEWDGIIDIHMGVWMDILLGGCLLVLVLVLWILGLRLVLLLVVLLLILTE